MAQLSWDLDAQAVVVVFDDPEMVTIREALSKDQNFLQSAIKETLTVLARDFNDKAIRTAVFKAKMGTAGQFNQPTGAFILA